MTSDNEKEDLMARYLLGDADDEEKTRVEERFLSDHKYFEQLLSKEEELVEQYARGGLSASQRMLFEKNSVSERKKNAEFTLELIEDLQKKTTINHVVRPGFRSPFTRRQVAPLLLAAAALILLIVAPWIIVSSLRNRLQETRNEMATKERRAAEEIASQTKDLSELQRQIEILRQTPVNNDGSGLVSSRLKPYRGQRGGGGDIPVIPLAARIQVMVLEFYIENGQAYKSYQVKITPPEGAGSLTISGLKIEKGSSTLKIPLTASNLQRGDYTVMVLGEVDGAEPVAVDSYFFRVTKSV